MKLMYIAITSMDLNIMYVYSIFVLEILYIFNLYKAQFVESNMLKIVLITVFVYI